ncbi:hypothetical protein C8N43_2865 [Litoreibacter ponti]|uniref:Uncharacterized protein n=1 Tax=Litoreibacter ponti TaxID=1510457 RepID=A0A2T6BDA6_9RHOB|nr:hypothetical protein [Litoreibacter ponti]PTX54060.1 hypothetical protein C8N43_2865 [Litoreibacter ponti]
MAHRQKPRPQPDRFALDDDPGNYLDFRAHWDVLEPNGAARADAPVFQLIHEARTTRRILQLLEDQKRSVFCLAALEIIGHSGENRSRGVVTELPTVFATTLSALIDALAQAADTKTLHVGFDGEWLTILKGPSPPLGLFAWSPDAGSVIADVNDLLAHVMSDTFAQSLDLASCADGLESLTARIIAMGPGV